MLAVETARSATPPDERHDRLAAFAGPRQLVELGSAAVEEAVEEIIAATLGWLDGWRAGEPGL